MRGRGWGGGLYDVCEWCCTNPNRQCREPLQWWEKKKWRWWKEDMLGQRGWEHAHNHTSTQAHTAHCVCWFVCACVRETALQLTYRLHIKVNLYWTWCFALCRLEYRNAKANIGTASLIPPKNNKLWSLFWIFTSHVVFLRMQNTFFIMHRILKNIHDQKIPPHNYKR